jgi:hypothetical protein
MWRSKTSRKAEPKNGAKVFREPDFLFAGSWIGYFLQKSDRRSGDNFRDGGARPERSAKWLISSEGAESPSKIL